MIRKDDDLGDAIDRRMAGESGDELRRRLHAARLRTPELMEGERLSDADLDAMIQHGCSSGTDTPPLVRDAIVKAGLELRELRAAKVTGETSDGYHTFNELYEHRDALFIALCAMLSEVNGFGLYEALPWRSKLHSDGTMFDGWFIMGIRREPGHQISYHLPIAYWERTRFCLELDRAPPFDGHTSADVIQRLLRRFG
jgi:hypothetical protein